MRTPTMPDLEERYVGMTPDEFDAIDRLELTEEARLAYDEECRRRQKPVWVEKEAKRQQEVAAAQTAGLVGVGGWLLFFCISLTILSPVATAISLIYSFSQTGAYFNIYPGLKAISIADVFLSAALMTFSVYAGATLWRKRPNAVRIAKSYLFAFLGYTAIAAVLPFMAGLPSSANETLIGEAVKGLVRGFLAFGIWYSYLNNSKRVKATYPPAPPEIR